MKTNLECEQTLKQARSTMEDQLETCCLGMMRSDGIEADVKLSPFAMGGLEYGAERRGCIIMIKSVAIAFSDQVSGSEPLQLQKVWISKHIASSAPCSDCCINMHHLPCTCSLVPITLQ